MCCSLLNFVVISGDEFDFHYGVLVMFVASFRVAGVVCLRLLWVWVYACLRVWFRLYTFLCFGGLWFVGFDRGALGVGYLFILVLVIM